MNKKYLASTLRLGLLVILLAGLLFPTQYSVYALTSLTVKPLTWNVIGLDSNNVSVGPNHFPVGARVCNTGAEDATNVTATWAWDSSDPYIDLRGGTLSNINLGTLTAGTCADAYFEVEIQRNSNAYDHTRSYHIDVTAGNVTGTISTPTPREVYVEYLISQNRNGVDDISFGTSAGSLTSVAPGGTMTLMVGNTYYIRLDGHTATQGYEQIEYFINFPNTIFQILSVSSSFTADTSATVGPSPIDMLYGDNCVWENDPTAPNYRACLSVGKTGGTVSTLYEVKILQVPGAPLVNPEPLSTLIYDFSGSSFHYNADYDVATRFAYIVNASVEKSFSPKTITPGGTSTLTFTINNPGGSALTGVNFDDTFPAGVTVAGTPNLTTNGCGTPTLPSLTGGETSLSFSNITVDGYGACRISVNVTASTDGTYVNTSGNLFINTNQDTGDNAADTLVVSSKPPVPSTCGSPVTLATWTMPTVGQGSGGPPPPYTTIAASGVSTAIASASLTGAGVQSIVAGATTNAWSIVDAWTDTTAPPGAVAPYFQFALDTSNYGGAVITFDYELSASGDWASGVNNHIYVYSSTDNVTYTLASTINATKGSWQTGGTATAAATGLGTTYFRLLVDTRNGSKTTSTVALDNIVFTGCPRPVDPTLSKAFSPTTIAEGSASTLTFTFANPNAFSLTGVGFSDTLPTGLLIATPNGLAQSCTTGTFTGASVTATAGTSTVDVSGGTLSANASCTISVNVEGVVAGSYTNISNPITSTETGPNTSTDGYGTSSLTVVAPPVINKSFTANPIFTGNYTTLNFTITNPNNATALTGVAVTDVLPAGLTVADGTFNACGGTNNLTTTNATGTITLTGGTIAANGSCTLSVTVTGSTVGLKTNTTGNVTSTNGGTGNTTTADVLVKDPESAINILKQVGPSASGPWTPYLTTSTGADIYYRFIVENVGDLALTNVSIDDPTLSGEESCSWVDGDGTVLGVQPINLPIADANDNQLATCVFGPVSAVSGEYTNTVTATFTGATPADEPTSSATYATVTIDKDTSTPALDPNGTVTYTIVVVNSGDQDLTNFQVTDALPDFNGGTAGNGYTVTAVTAPGFTVNFPGFDGSTDTNLLAGTDTLSNNTTATITITLDLTDAVAGTYDNTAVATTDQTGSIDDDGTSADDAGTPGSGADPETDEDVAIFDAQPSKSIVTTSEPSTGVVASAERVAIGEMVRYRLASRIPEGSFTNVQLVDGIPNGLQFLDDGTATVALVCNGGAACMTSSSGDLTGAGLVVSGSSNNVSPTFSVPVSAISGGPYGSGTDVTFSFGDITNFDVDSDAEYIVVEFNAIVLNVNTTTTINQGVDNDPASPTAGDSNSNFRANDVTLFVNSSQVGATSPNATVDIAEPAITSITKSVSPAVGPYLPGDSLTYTLLFSNNATGNNATTAFDIVLNDTFDSNLTLGTINVTSTQGTSGVDTCAGGTTFITSNSTVAQLLTVNVTCLDPGETVTVTVDAMISGAVASGTTIANTSALTYTSLPGTQGNCSSSPFTCADVGGTGSGMGERTGDDGPGADNTVLDNYATTSNTTNTLVEFGSITITKDAVPDDAQDFTFTGTGPSGYDFGGGFSLDDDADGTLSNTQTFAPLVPGSYTVTEGSLIFLNWTLTNLTCVDPDNGSTTDLIFATATIDLDFGEDINCTFTNTFNGTANLTIAKTDNDADDTVLAGGSFDWTITVTNNGGSTASFADTQVLMSDALPGVDGYYTLGAIAEVNGATAPTGTIDCVIVAGPSLSCAANGAVTMPAGASFSVTFMVTPTVAGTLANTAVVDPGNVVSESDETVSDNQSSNTITVTPQADLSITKDDGVTSVNAGGTTIYKVRVTNNGPSNVGSAVLSDPAVVGLNKTGVVCSVTPGQCVTPPTVAELESGTFTLPDLASGAFYEINVTADVTASSGSVINTATITPPAGTTDPDNTNNSASDTDTVNAVVDLAITKTDGVFSYVPGVGTTYTVTVTNNGSSDVIGVIVADTKPAEITTWDWACTSQTGGAAGCTPAPSSSNNFTDSVDIPNGGSIVYTVTANTDPAATGNLVNTATVTAPVGTTDPTPGNNTSTDLDEPAPQSDLSITKDDGVTNVNAGGTTTYTIRVTNNGPSSVTGAILSDPAAVGLSKTAVVCSATPGQCVTPPTLAQLEGGTFTLPTLASGEFYEISVTADVTASSGSVTNTATTTPPVGTTDPDNTNNSASDTDTVNEPENPVIGAAKDMNATGTGPWTVTIDYVFENFGNVTLDNLTSSDNLSVVFGTAGPDWSFTSISSTPAAFANPAYNGSTVTELINQAPTQPLGVGGTASISVTITVNTPGSYNNQVTVYGDSPLGTTVNDNSTDGTDPDPNGDNTPDEDTPTPLTLDFVDLSLTKTVDNSSPMVASNITFTLTVTNANTSTIPATNVVVSDVIPGGFSYVSDVPSQGTYNNGTGDWSVGTLAIGASATLNITVSVNVTGPYVNYAEITGVDQVDPDSTPGNSSITEDDDDSVTVTPTQNDPSGLSKSFSDSNQAFTTNPNVAIGEIVEFTVDVTIPPGVFTNSQMVDTMERGLSFMACSSITPSDAGLTTDVAGSFASACSTPTVDDASGGTTVDVGRRVTFDLGTLTNSSGSDQTLSFVYTAVVLDSAANVSGVVLNNSAEWTSDSGILSPASASVLIVEPDLSISKTASTSLVSVGSEVTITLTIQHTGDSETDAYDTVVTDVLPAELQYVPASLSCASGAQVPDVTCSESGGTITAEWSNFTLGGGNGQVTFRVTVVSLPASGISNVANVAWSSLPNVVGAQNSNVFSTERDYDPTSSVDVYGASDTLVIGVFNNNQLPATGFAPNVVTDLGNTPSVVYQQTGGVTVEVPSLGINLPIVGVPLKNGEWDVSWLGNQAGWLAGSAFPSWSGNSVLTGHVYGSNGLPGPFVNLNSLKYGDKIVVHAYGQKYTYEVRTNAVVAPNDASVLKHEEKAWITLVTCKEYDEKTNTYGKRVVVRAVLVSVGWE